MTDDQTPDREAVLRAGEVLKDEVSFRDDLRKLCEASKGAFLRESAFYREVTPETVLRLLDAHEADLADLGFVIEQVGEVYAHITNGMLSKPNYYAHVVIAMSDDVVTEVVQESVDEALEPFREILEDDALGLDDVRTAMREALNRGKPAITIVEQTDVTVEDMGTIGGDK